MTAKHQLLVEQADGIEGLRWYVLCLDCDYMQRRRTRRRALIDAREHGEVWPS